MKATPFASAVAADVLVRDGRLAMARRNLHIPYVELLADSSESPVHGEQEQSAYNGHFESVCYHPLFVFNPKGDCLAAKLRPGNVHSAGGWDEVLLPIVDRYRRRGQTVVVRRMRRLPCPPSMRPWNGEG